MTPNDDQTPRTSPAPHPLDDQLPPSLFAPPGRGSPPPLFGPAVDRTPPPEGELPPRPGAEPTPPQDVKPAPGSDVKLTPGSDMKPASPQDVKPVPGSDLKPVPGSDVKLTPGSDADAAPTPGAEPTPVPEAKLPPPLFGPVGKGSPPPLFGPPVDKALPPDAELPRRPGAEPTPPLFGGAGRGSAPPAAGKVPPAPPRTGAPEPPDVSLHLGPSPDRRPDGPGGPIPAAAGGRAGERPASDRPTPDRRPEGPAPAASSDDRLTPGGSVGDRSTPARPVPLDGNLHLKPVRRLRTEPSADWTPHPSYGAEPGAGKGPTRKASPGNGPRGDDPGPDTELDLVLDLASGDRAASATFSVPVSLPVPASPTAAATPTPAAATPSYPGRRHSVIANETTASIPVHLLFRDDQEPAEPGAAAALPAAVVRRPATGDRSPATRRPPVPRSPQTRVQPSTRPAPAADPRLAERPGPALPGSAALLVGAAGIAGGLAVLWWRGALPAAWQTAVGLAPRADLGVGFGAWALLALLATVVLLALGGLGRGRVGYAWVLTLFGDYRGSVRRTGLVWVSPLLLRRRVDVRLRHWRSEPLPAVDANGTALRVVVLVVWRIDDTVRAVLGIEDHEAYLSAQVEAAMARVLSQLPADAFHEDAPSLRDAEAVGDALTRMLKADCEPVGVEVYSAQPTGIEYAPEVAAAMQRRRIAAIDSKHRDSVLTSVVDAVDDTVNRLTTRGIVELDDYERKALVKDLTVAFYTGRSGGGDGA
ncbi:SPFH domain-containing protein [Streptomyces sp. NPDC091287]|uniref:SPFH domain-containing protein n=1 Tax=Streptomyces sp. NPDC091287 TaxID=3365988 RepID=UPI003821AC49